MNKTKLLSLTAIMMLCLSASLWAGGQAEAGAAEDKEYEAIVVTDSSGREITIPGQVESIAYSFSFGEPLNILGAWDKVVAVDGSHQGGAIEFPGIEELPVISSPGNCFEVNYEKVMELAPDIFLTTYFPYMPEFDELVKTLEPEIPVVALDLTDPETFVENLEKLGLILGREQEAADFAAFYNETLNDIKGRLSGLSEADKPRVFYKTGMGTPGDLMTYTDETKFSEHRSMVTWSENIAAALPSQGGWVYSVDPEWLVETDPDVIIDFGMYNGIIGADADDLSAAADLYDRIAGLEALSGTKAVKTGNLFILWTESFTGSGFIVNYAYLAKRFHPELFKDFDPVAVHQKYYSEYLNIDFDVRQQGIFVYP